jgi:hypothetical protein
MSPEMQANIAFFKGIFSAIKNGGVWVYPDGLSAFRVNSDKKIITQLFGLPLKPFVKESILRAGYSIVESIEEEEA